ncbi:MAG: EamA family transporter [Burkholderiales bacterium PBB4]|nr:MAG: EamA family transporter [Burkholderiales bacterium PBB4]
MPVTALGLVVLAGLIHACWNIVAKKAGGDVRFSFFSSVVMMVAWAPLGLWLAWHQVPDWGRLEWSLVAVSGMLHSAYFVILLRGYRKADLTVVYPLARGSGPLLSSVAAIALLGEQLSALGGFGILGVVVGVFFIAGGPGLFKNTHSPDQARRIRKGMLYGLLTGVFIASYTVVDGYAVKVALMSPVLIDYMGNFVRLALLTPAIVRDPEQVRRQWKLQWKYATVVGVVSPVSYVLVLYALQVAPLSHVAPAREVSMLFAALIGGHLLGEGDRLFRAMGALAIAMGVMALALG